MEFANFNEFLKELSEATPRRLSAARKLHEIAEPRLDRTEITIQVLLEDLRRHREQRTSQ